MKTQEILAVISERRQSICEIIKRHPERFCICEGCDSVLALPIKTVCRVCHAYRFDHSAERIIASAIALGSKPFAASCPVIPRYVQHINEA